MKDDERSGERNTRKEYAGEEKREVTVRQERTERRDKERSWGRVRGRGPRDSIAIKASCP